ncbi:extracellular solute-binding protein [Chelativorans salis]|uniref:Extracellular solute-binding protein n=1 Tax=Chelativorans salis TaxID=2978478 RepID=A0ABT2LV43_9HYPH|nr:extracellular solute-binding protein [Chelativorans sp. EGI FJ00035]MCT7378256.1 extracellular solute-binding protein [Chelativorans sp. EGI FJ00035]
MRDSYALAANRVGFFAYILAAALSVVPLSQASGGENGRLVMAATGGDYERKLREFVFEPFSRQTGIEVVLVSGTTGEFWAKAMAMSEAGHLQWDMMEAGSGDVFVPARNRLLVDLGEDCALVSKAKSDGAGEICHRFGVVPTYGATLLTANRTMFDGGAPSSWNDFFNVADFPGPRSLPNFSTPWRVLIGALLADGVAPDKLFPLDLDRAFDKLDQIRPHISLWWKTGDQIQRALRDQEVAMTLVWNTRIDFLRDEGLPLQRVWRGWTLNEADWVVFKGAPNRQNALRFLNWYFDHPEVQAAFAQAIAASPTTKSALELLPQSDKEDSPIFPDNFKGVVEVDYTWLANHHAEIVERWNRWIAQ